MSRTEGHDGAFRFGADSAWRIGTKKKLKKHWGSWASEGFLRARASSEFFQAVAIGFLFQGGQQW